MHYPSKTFVKFLIVGAINTLFGYLIFTILILLNIRYESAALISTMCGVLFNFKTTGLIVFKNKKNTLIFKFIGVYAIIYLLQIFLLKQFLNHKINIFIAEALILLPLALLSYILNKIFVFSKGKEDKEQM
ncbi:GtrA family protein [Nostoc sp. ChiQUE01b]|uniref:GtrA family protein n=1 Tax=Nostoc sp. ChiQUE01b TaxID=3075376 RepID=UPI002AD2F7C2|nr:GtrA family protein [Nostoc sp. ChiQUE01b]MDZ8257299.1 GtrA family protein [Nostoc sp. ChiQUE01b]